MNKKIAILGSGSWGIGLSILLNKNGYDPFVWSFAQDEADLINKEHMFLKQKHIITHHHSHKIPIW